MPEKMQVAPALTRALQFTPGDGGPVRDVLVTIGPPKQNGDDFDVTLEIIGFDKPHRTEHPGVDPIAATLFRRSSRAPYPEIPRDWGPPHLGRRRGPRLPSFAEAHGAVKPGRLPSALSHLVNACHRDCTWGMPASDSPRAAIIALERVTRESNLRGRPNRSRTRCNAMSQNKLLLLCSMLR